jgi:hypothetical protein
MHSKDVTEEIAEITGDKGMGKRKGYISGEKVTQRTEKAKKKGQSEWTKVERKSNLYKD